MVWTVFSWTFEGQLFYFLGDLKSQTLVYKLVRWMNELFVSFPWYLSFSINKSIIPHNLVRWTLYDQHIQKASNSTYILPWSSLILFYMFLTGVTIKIFNQPFVLFLFFSMVFSTCHFHSWNYTILDLNDVWNRNNINL